MNDAFEIKHCDPLSNNILRVENIKKNETEIIQPIIVEKGPNNKKLRLPPPPAPLHKATSFDRFIVSSKYGIIEMDIYVDWAEEKIKNTP